MGLFKSIRDLNAQSKEINEDWDPGAQAQDAVEQMKAANQMMADQAETAKLATEGVDASGTITAVQQGNAMVNFQPTVSIEVTVMRDGMPPYPATASQVVPQVQLAMLQPGNTVELKVAPDDPQKIWIDLSRPVT